MPAAIETRPPPPAPIPRRRRQTPTRRNANHNRPPRPGEQMSHHVVSCHEDRETYDKTPQSARGLRTLCKKKTANDRLQPQNDNSRFLSRKSNPASCHKAPKNFANFGPIWPLQGIRYPIDTLPIPPKTPQPAPIRPNLRHIRPHPGPTQLATDNWLLHNWLRRQLATGNRPLATAVPSNGASQRAAMNNVRERMRKSGKQDEHRLPARARPAAVGSLRTPRMTAFVPVSVSKLVAARQRDLRAQKRVSRPHQSSA